MPLALVPIARLERFVGNFIASHGAVTLSVRDGGLHADAEDGSTFDARLPFGRVYDGPADVALFRAGRPAGLMGLVLVRKGGFAVARVEDGAMVAHKIGSRYVQSRTAAGGQSQQRFARRRANQARTLYSAAAEEAARLLPGVDVVVGGGDKQAVTRVLAQAGLAGGMPAGHLTTPDPNRRVVDAAVIAAQAISADVENAT